MAVFCLDRLAFLCRSFSSAKAVQQALRLEEIPSGALTSDSAATTEGSSGEDGITTDQEGESR